MRDVWFRFLRFEMKKLLLVFFCNFSVLLLLKVLSFVSKVEMSQ